MGLTTRGTCNCDVLLVVRFKKFQIANLNHDATV
jgi:hypothetical protein